MAHSPGFARLRRIFAIATWARRNGVAPEDAAEAFDAARIARRSVLQGIAVAAAGAAVGCHASAREDRLPESSGVRVAVVGAGIAGLHCAWRLRQAGVDVTVYEAQSRVGGRMWTDRETFAGALFEIGGELIDSNHATMFALAEEFGITLDDRWAFEPAGMTRETVFMDGARVDAETLLRQTIALADVFGAAVEAAESSDTAFAELDATPLDAWLDANVPVAEYPELHETLRVAFVGEFGLEADEQSVLNMLYMFGYDVTDEFLIFGDSDERWHVHGGNDRIPAALADAVGPDSIRTGSRLVRASGPATGPYVLRFESADGPYEVEADHVVFALPFTLLRRVDVSDLALSDPKREVIDELGYGTNAKIMGRFASRPWWDQANESGLLTSDLPLQQGWDTTIGQDGVDGGVWTNFVGGEVGVACGEGSASDWFGGVTEQLETVWPGTRDAWTGEAARMHWPTFAWSLGSYACYRPGQWAFWGTEGAREGNVHFCGEHCSLEFQGWMEGGAETGGLVAAEILDDLGVPHDHALVRAVGRKMRVPQPCYHGAVATTAGPWMSRARRLGLVNG